MRNPFEKKLNTFNTTTWIHDKFAIWPKEIQKNEVPVPISSFQSETNWAEWRMTNNNHSRCLTLIHFIVLHRKLLNSNDHYDDSTYFSNWLKYFMITFIIFLFVHFQIEQAIFLKMFNMLFFSIFSHLIFFRVLVLLIIILRFFLI